MEFRISNSFRAVVGGGLAGLGLGLMMGTGVLSLAHAELVYEDDIPTTATVTTPTQRLEDRTLTRETLGSAEKVHATLQAPAQVQPQVQIVQQPIQPILTPVAPVSPVLSEPAAAPATEVQNMSRSELMRRERMRTELKNEDILQERLEELRLRDENQRTNQLLGAQPAETAVAPTGAVAPMQQEVVTAPVTENPGQGAVAPTGASVAQVAVAGTGTSSALMVAETDASEKTMISIQPRGGLASMNNTTGYDVRPHYSAGIGLEVGVSDNVSFELGYSYSEYGVALNNANPFVPWAYSQFGYSNTTFESYALKQNVGDIGLKLHFLGPDAKLRPFIGGGAAYAKSFLNYDEKILNYWRQYGYASTANDYEASQFLGFLSAGLDVRVNKSVSIGATFKYYNVLSSRQNESLNNSALYGMYPGQYGYSLTNPYGLQVDPGTAALGGTLADSGFYTILAGVNFSF